MPVVTLAEAKDQLSIAAADHRDDDEITGYLAGLDSIVERETGVVVAQRAFVEEIEVHRSRSFMLSYVPVVTLDTVVRIDGGTSAGPYDLASFHLSPTGRVRVLDGTVNGLIEVTYTAGYASDEIPENFKRGALVVLQHAWELQRGVGTSPATDVSPDGIPARYLVPDRAREWFGTPMPSPP